MLNLNVQRLITEYSNLKNNYFNEHTKDNNIMLIKVTETWLNQTIQRKPDLEHKIFHVDRIETL